MLNHTSTRGSLNWPLHHKDVVIIADLWAAVALPSIAVKTTQTAVLSGHMSPRIYSSGWFSSSSASPRNQYMATCAIWLTRNSSRRCSVGVHAQILAQLSAQTTKPKPLISLFSFDCSTSSLKCLHAAHVLSKKRQRLLKHRKRSAASDSSDTDAELIAIVRICRVVSEINLKSF